MAACLEPKFTAADPSFPTFLDSEGHVICLTPDRYDDLSFVLGGAYVEMGADGEPMDDVWKGSASDFVRAEGYVAAKEWSKTEIETNSSRVFYSPAKSRRFAMKVLNPEKLSSSAENLLVLKEGKWARHALCPQADDKTKYNHEEQPEMTPDELSYLTYLNLYIAKENVSEENMAKTIMGKDKGTVCVWNAGSCLVHLLKEGQDIPERTMSALPQRISVAGATFISGLWVPADKREEFFVTISNEPTVAITGATLEKNSIFGSPVATMAAETVGRFLRESALKDHMMCSASMRVYPDSTSFDADLTKPWQEAGGRVAQFTGSNIQMLHGAAWDIEHGTSYIIEEDIGDFSNHTKEAALFAGLKHPTSAFILGNGGPTVNINLTRAMALCPAGHVFSLAGCCSAEGQFRGSSAAIGSIPMKKESQEDALLSLGKFAPHFFTWLPSVEELGKRLAERELTIFGPVKNGAEAGAGVTVWKLEVGKGNPTKITGFDKDTTTEEYEAYAAMVREHVNRVYINTSQVFGKRLDALAGRKNIDGPPGDSPTVLHLLSTWLEKSGGWDCKDVFCTPPAKVTEFPDYIKMKERLDNGDFSEYPVVAGDECAHSVAQLIMDWFAGMPDGLLGSVEQFPSTAASEEAAFGQLNELEEPLSNIVLWLADTLNHVVEGKADANADALAGLFGPMLAPTWADAAAAHRFFWHILVS